MSGKRRATPKTTSRSRAGGRQGAKQSRSRPRRILKGLLALSLVGALLGVLAFAILYVMIDVPDPNRDFQTETTHVHYAGGKQELGRFSTQNRDSIPLSQMPESLQAAVVAAEDRSFWTNEGIDPQGIVRAAFSNVQGNPTQGASTITQQYVKVLYLNQDVELERKVREAILALKIQRQESKTRILEGYLNTIYFGRGAYGVQAAAQAYFNRDAADLNLRQSAVLAAILNNPNSYEPTDREERERLLGRYQFVLDGMADMGTIPDQRAEKARRRLPKFPKVQAQSTYGGQKGHMLMMVREELLRLGFTEQEIDGGGLQVTTTFTKKAMNAARKGVKEERPEGFGDKQLHAAVASVEPGSGAVRGFYAGQDYLQSQINWAVSGGQAGSTLKAFAVAAAIKDGFSLESTFEGNSPFEVPGTDAEVENQGDTDYGSSVTMEQATEDSINTAFLDMTLAMDNGGQKIIDTMNEMGIPPVKEEKDQGEAAFGFPSSTPGLQPTAGVALGSATVSPINLATGYATIANEGVYAEPYIIEKVVDEGGETRYEHQPRTKRVLDRDIAADVSYALQQVVTSGTGTSTLGLGRPAGGKTGTATNGRDEVSSSWYVGYTPQMSTAVMYVRGQGNEALDGWLPEFFGSSYPAATWTNVMSTLMEGLPVEEFPPPEYVEGDPPTSGHEPYTPPPEPEPSPSPTRSKSPSPSPSKTQKPSPSRSPSPTEPPTSSPSPTQPSMSLPTETADGENGNGGGGNNRGGNGGGDGGGNNPNG